MTCNIKEIRKQLEEMQTLLDTYERCHVDSVTPEEKAIVDETKAKCVDAIRTNHRVGSLLSGTEQAIVAVNTVK